MKRSRHVYRILFIALLLSAFLLFTVLLKAFLRLDKISEIPQSTMIQDRTGKELFRFFEEDRHRLMFEEISPHMIDAIVAVEDQTFRENKGVDPSGLLRAIKANLAVRRTQSGQLQGGSTITQQLVKNIYLTKDKTVSRKLQELVLAKQLTEKRINVYQATGLSAQEAKRKAKESIITAYLNYVFFGNRSYGIDAAARHYFKTSAKELSLLQSAILAALPQAPSIYNPSVNQQHIMGFRSVPIATGTSIDLALNMRGSERIYEALSGKVLHLRNNCLPELINRATVDAGNGQAMYTHGRKDRVLCRLWETKKINEQQLKEAFLTAKDVIFYKPSYAIQAPHFMFRVQQYVLTLPVFADRQTTFEQLSQGGYTIVTTLDSELQKSAETSLQNYTTFLERLGGNNRAMLHIDSTNGDVLSYVGSLDFYDESRDGQVDVLRSLRQVGSTIKPFFYAYLFSHYPTSPDSNIVDMPYGKYSPQNHDGLFWGKTSIATALAGSRNLPVVRLFEALGGANTFVPYLQALGFNLLNPATKQYRYPLALGADEATLLQLAQAYTQLSVTGDRYPVINPIQRVIASDGTIIYEKPASRYTKLIPDTVGEMIRSVLENQAHMPADRRWLLNLPVQHIALKTGTSDVKVKGKPYPRDGVSVVYTPTDVIVSRAGNTDGKAMGPKAFGGEINHYPLKDYLQDAVTQGKIKDQPRITTTQYSPEGGYAYVDHHGFTPEQQTILQGE